MNPDIKYIIDQMELSIDALKNEIKDNEFHIEVCTRNNKDLSEKIVDYTNRIQALKELK